MPDFARTSSDEGVRIRFALTPPTPGLGFEHDPYTETATSRGFVLSPRDVAVARTPLISTTVPAPALPSDPGPFALSRSESHQRVTGQPTVVLPTPTIEEAPQQVFGAVTGLREPSGTPIDQPRSGIVSVSTGGNVASRGSTAAGGALGASTAPRRGTVIRTSRT